MTRTYVSIDLEMTSARAEGQEIIEIAAIKFQGDRTIDQWSTLVNPGVPLPLNIQVLTGIRQSELARAPSFERVADRLRDFVGDYPLVAHTVSADVRCLARKGMQLTNPEIDTFELASILFPQLGGYSLASLTAHFGIRTAASHRAVSDALATKELFNLLVRRALELDLAILEEINRLAARIDWPLKEYFREIEERRRRESAGSSIRDQLAAKGGIADVALDVLLAAPEERPPLVPAPRTRPIDVEATAELIEPGGAVARAFPGYEHRPPQAAMLRAVARALNDGQNLIVEAGTGTGKGFAYLIPAIRFSVQNGERVVVSTNTINLQDQLYTKDLPDLRVFMPEPFEMALLKGRANYLCLRRWAAMRRRLDLTPTEVLVLIKVLIWLPQTETGDVAELNMSDVARPVWSRLCSSVDTCSPRRCQDFRRSGCFLYLARARAAAANVVVVNHALLLSDVAADNKVLPEHRYLIVDEAHHLEDEATAQLGYSVRYRAVQRYLDDLSAVAPERRGILGDLAAVLRVSKVPLAARSDLLDRLDAANRRVDEARSAAAAYFAALGAFARTQAQENRGYDQRVRLTSALRRQSGWHGVEVSWEQLLIALVQVQDEVAAVFTRLEPLEGNDLPDFEALLGAILAAIRFNEDLRVQGQAFSVAPDSARVYWTTLAGATQDVSVHAAPLGVGDALESQLYAAKTSVILTSATLATAGSFAYARSRLGLSDARELLVESPFDYATSTLIYLPTDIAEPDRPPYQQQLAGALIELCLATGGRALALFTSHSQLRQTWGAIKRPLEERGILVLAHGVDGSSRRQLLQAFKTNPRSVLLGTSSFWEGVDVVGDALSVLAIAKLPFAVPTDPVVAARAEQFDDPFSEYSLPQTILKFKQGFGRLIRSASDRGVAIVFDRRVQTKAYGRMFLTSLPPATIRQGPLRDLVGATIEWIGRGQPEPR